MTGKNIDYIASRYAQTLIKNVSDYGDVMTAATKILGVLTEDGIYAAFLYIFAKVKDGIRTEFVCGALRVLNDVGLVVGSGSGFSKLAEDYRNRYIDLEKAKEKRRENDVRRLKNKIHNLQDNILETISDITNDLNKTLLARLVLERFLTYVRYHAKAKGG